MGFRPKSVAEKNYQRRLVITMSAYLLIIFGTTSLVRHGHVTGWLLYFFALLPAIPVLKLIHVVAQYLQEEKDEFLRLQVTQSILLSTAITLGVLAVSDFLRSYTPTGNFAPFSLFVLFWITFGVTNGIQSARNRVGADDEPA